MTFSSLGLAERVSSNVAALGYTNPTPIQEQAIPAVLAGRDLIGLAQTGTGKTAAFALPIIDKLSAVKSRYVRSLIVAPTRELAQQITEAIKKYAAGTGLKTCAIYGGVRMGSQLKKLKEGVDIVVGCPGRLVDHIQRKTLNVSKIEILVLDEADHMFDMGFLPDIKKLISFIPKQRQTLLFSATMPKEIRGLAEAILNDPQSIKVSDGEMAATVSHALFPVSTELKSQLLEKILKQFEVTSTIIFARTKMRTKRLADSLQRNGYKVACLQGNLSQQRRQEAIQGFRDGKFDILVATDLAARGIDVQQVTHVINFDIPMTVEGYTHRIGRTGRAAREGEAFTLISREDESRVRAIERHLGSGIERRRIDDFDYGNEAYRGAAPAKRERAERPEGQRRTRPFNRSDKRSESADTSGRSFSRGSARGPRPDGERREKRFDRRPEDLRERRTSEKDSSRPRFDRDRKQSGFRVRSEGGFRGKPAYDQGPDLRARSSRPDSDSESRTDRPKRSFDRESYAQKRGYTNRESLPQLTSSSEERKPRVFTDEARTQRSHGPRPSRPAGQSRFGSRSSDNKSDRPSRSFSDRSPGARGSSRARPAASRGRFKSRPR